MFHDKSNYIEIKYHYIRDMVQRVVRLRHISSDEQIEDTLTKALPKGKFLVFREQLGLMDVTLLSKDLNLSRTLSYALPSYLSSQGEELSQRAPGVEETLDNRIVCDSYLAWYVVSCLFSSDRIVCDPYFPR